MRIFPINNISKNLIKKTARKPKISLNSAIAIGGAALILTSGYIKRDEWKAFFEQIEKARVENVQHKPLQSKFATQEAALNYAFDVVTDYLIKENREYSVHINNNKHKIISECAGTDSSVLNFAPLKMFFNKAFDYDFTFTQIHGHPPYKNGATGTFSLTDFNTFITQDDCTESYVLNKDRKFCRFRKTNNYKKPTEAEMLQLKKDYERMIMVSKFKHKTVIDSKNNILFSIVDEPAMHSFWTRMCYKFGIEYITTFGTYGLFDDIYENGYNEAFNKEIETDNEHIPII